MRATKVNRDQFLRVRLTEAEMKALDRARGAHSRSNYVRMLLRTKGEK